MMIHSKTKSLELIEKLSKLRLCMNMYRLSSLSMSVRNNVTDADEQDSVFISMNFENGVSSTASVDNKDLKTKARLLTTSLQETSASLNQLSTTLNKGESREKYSSIQRNDELNKLPTWYTKVKTFHLPNDIIMST